MIRRSELTDAKTWRLCKQLTAHRKALAYNRSPAGRRSGLARLMEESLTEEIAQLEQELARRRAAGIV